VTLGLRRFAAASVRFNKQIIVEDYTEDIGEGKNGTA
jgi:hypothetical protein